MVNDESKNPKNIIPVGSPDGKQLKEEIGQVIENASENLVVVLRKTKSGWMKYVGTNPEEGELVLAQTRSEINDQKIKHDKNDASIKQGYLKIIFEAAGDFVNKVKRGY